VTIITTAFKSAGDFRLSDLGLPNHPLVVVQHPLASRNAAEVQKMAEGAVASVAAALQA